MTNEIPKPQSIKRLEQVYLRPSDNMKRIEQGVETHRSESIRRHQIIELLSFYSSDPTLITALDDESNSNIFNYYGLYRSVIEKKVVIPIHGLLIISSEQDFLILSGSRAIIVRETLPDEVGNKMIESITKVTDENFGWYFNEGQILGPTITAANIAQRLSNAVNKFTDRIEEKNLVK